MSSGLRESVVRGIFFYLFSALLSGSAFAQNADFSLSIPLNDFYNSKLVGVNLVYEFGVTDRVYISAPQYHELDGHEVFRGRIQSVAVDQYKIDQILATIPASIQQRIHFFPAYLTKRKMNVGIESHRLNTQSFFTDSAKTYVFEFDYNHGLTFLEMGKVYSSPEEIMIKYSESIRANNENGNNAHPRYKTLDIAVAVREERPAAFWPHISVNSSESQAERFVESFGKMVREANEAKTVGALKDIALHLDSRPGSMTEADLENLRTLDQFLLKKVSVSKVSIPLPKTSNAEDLRSAIESRLLLYGMSPQDIWIFHFDPLMQNAERDFISLTKDWKNIADPANASAFVHADRGIVVMRAFTNDMTIESKERGIVALKVDFPPLEAALGEKGSLIIPNDTETFENELRRQQRAGIQGNSEAGIDLLEDFLIREKPQLRPMSCKSLFLRS